MSTSPTVAAMSILPNPKKRPSGNPSQSAKRTKLQHPLRQTSFPSSEAQAALYTSAGPRSDTGSVSGSLMSGTSGAKGGKRSRGRPKKRASQIDEAQIRQDDEDNEGLGSILEGMEDLTGSRKKPGGPKSTGSALENDAPAEDDDELDNPLLADPNSAESLRLQSDLALEKANIATLQDALTLEQMARYVAYTRTKIKENTLRKIVNQVVSQSVTTMPLQNLQWVAKAFLGEAIEGARVVQEEWAERWDEERERADEEEAEEKQAEKEKVKSEADRDGTTSSPEDQDQDMDQTLAAENATDTNNAQKDLPTTSTASPIPTKTSTSTSITPPTPTDPDSRLDSKVDPPSRTLPWPQSFYANANPHRGGLLPAHLREAQRRARVAGDGGGTGFGGLSHGNLGVKGEAVGRVGLGGRGGGGRMFR